MDPNLLPQNLRTKEAKELERLKKQSRSFEIELNKPKKDKISFDVAGSDKPKLSLWQKIFGISEAKSVNASILTNPSVDKSDNSHMNWLASGGHTDLSKHKQKETYKIETKPRVAKSNNWLANLLGKPVSPILPAKEIKSVHGATIKPVEVKRTTVISDYKKAAPEIKSQPKSEALVDTKIKNQKLANDSWWSILRGLFGFSNIREEKLHFASDLLSEARVEVKTPIKPVEIKPTPKVKEKVSKQVKSSYNLVPKREKSNFDVNLIPQELKMASQVGSIIDLKLWLMAIIFPVLLITAGYFLIIYMQQDLEKEMSLNKNQLTELNRQIGDFVVKEKQNNRIAQKVSTIKKLLNEKILWSNFFTLLEKYTLDGVYFTSLTADTSGILILPGIADNYSVLAQQLAVFRDADEFVKEVKISNAQLYSEAKAGVLGSSFQIRLTLQDGIFKRIK